MASASLDLEQELFARCLEHPPSEWEGLLAAHCEDAQLRERVRKLLQYHRDTPTHDSGLLRLDGSDPEHIGPYRILRRLGEGGMGIVYAAEQLEPVRRRVAVKVLRAGYNSREVLARFDVERQALSLMTHPNIARILDAGTTADHRPYMVMEYVPGEPLTQYCAARRLSLRSRLALFRTVCEAVQHAHQKGVIHRDLKPSNILVMEEDGRAIPKVIDFGIAKAVTERLTDRTLETRVGSFLGTPDYMSPEQAEHSPLDVDTRADVYALGSVLYQLLAGTPPLELSGLSYGDMQRAIREHEPAAPSSRVPGAQRHAIRGELDWITLKALEKDRNRRYPTAAALGDDIALHLAGEVPMAGPRTLRYRMSKFASRHALGVSTLAGIFLLVSAFAILMTWQVGQTTMERDRANREAEIARQVTRFTASLFELANPGETGTPDISARELLDIGSRQLERQAAEQDDDVRAALFEAAATAYLGLGIHDRADTYMKKVLDLRAGAAGAKIEDRANSLLILARLRAQQGDLAAAEGASREAVALLENADNAAARLDAHAELADILRRAGKPEEAVHVLEAVLPAKAGAKPDPSDEEVHALVVLGRAYALAGRLDESVQLLARLLEGRPDDERSLDILEIKNALATVLVERGESEQAVPLLRDVVSISRDIFGDAHWHTGVACNNLGNALSDLPGAYAEAEAAYLEGRAIIRASLGDAHPEMATVQSNLATLYMAMQRWEDAEPALRESIDIRLQTLGAHPYTANTIVGRGYVLDKLGRSREAEPLVREGLAMFIQTVGEDSWRTANARMALASVLLGQGKFDAAEAELEQARQRLTATLGEDHWRTARAVQRLQELQEARAAAAR